MKIAIIGYGKMGKEVESVAVERNHEIVLKANLAGDINEEILTAADVAIEFTSPENAVDNIYRCFDVNLPIVVGELGNGGVARKGSGMETFRKAQEAGTGKISKALFVPTHQFARSKDLSPNIGHGHHWFGNAESYFLVGEALGQSMKKLLNP